MDRQEYGGYVRSLLSRSLVFFLAALVSPRAVKAQEPDSVTRLMPGLLTGVVTDSTTGSPLDRAHIIVRDVETGHKLAASTTGHTGFYLLRVRPPGWYRITVWRPGFGETHSPPLRVRAGRVTHFDVELYPVPPPEPITGHPLFERHFATARDSLYGRLEPGEILAIQVDFHRLEAFEDMTEYRHEHGREQWHIQGGRYAEAAWMIDGVEGQDPMYRGAGIEPPAGAIRELVIAQGALPARWGESAGPAVNLITHRGGKHTTGSIRITSSELSGHPRDESRDLTRTEATLGGPLPWLSNLTFFLAGEAGFAREALVHRDGIVFDTDPGAGVSSDRSRFPDPSDPWNQRGSDGRRIHPLDIYSGWLGYGYDTGWSMLAKLSHTSTQGHRQDLQWTGSWREHTPYTFTWRYSMLWGLPADVQRHYTMGTPRPGSDSPGDIIPGTGVVAAENEKNVVTQDADQYSLRCSGPLGRHGRYSLDLAYTGRRRELRVKRWVNDNGYRSDRAYYVTEGDTLWRPGDPMHEITLGPFPYSIDTLEERTFGYSRLTNRTPYRVEGSDLFWTNLADITRAGRFALSCRPAPRFTCQSGVFLRSQTFDQYDVRDLSFSLPYIKQARRTAVSFGGYLQGRYAADEIQIGLGLHYDRLDVKKPPFWIIIYPGPEDAFDERGEIRRAEDLSARLSVVIPASERLAVYVNSDVVYQSIPFHIFGLQAPVWDDYRYPDNLTKERTVTWRAGLVSHLSPVISLRTAYWGRESSGLLGARTYRYTSSYGAFGYELRFVGNYDALSACGVDVDLEYRPSSAFSAALQYRHLHAWTAGESVARDIEAEYRIGEALFWNTASWEIPHAFSATLRFLVPPGAGPAIAGWHPLERITALAVLSARSGLPYTPGGVDPVRERNCRRRPATRRIDLWIGRDIELFDCRADIFARVRNLTNRRNPLVVYAATGRSDDPGATGRSTMDYSDAYDRPHYYGTPRTIDLGLRISF